MDASINLVPVIGQRMSPMNQSGTFNLKFLVAATVRTMVVWIAVWGHWVDWGHVAWGQAPTVSPSDQFAAPAPVMTFLDVNTGQPWGRYIVSETVTVPKYEYQEVKERVWVPTWVQEPRSTTVTQYDSVVSYQLRPRSVPSWNPFTPPQQILEYAPIVQYQPRNVQATQMTTYQKYEERETTRMIPVLVNASEQRSKFVDRPLSSPPGAGPMASNMVQESAMVAQATRTSARYPTRSIDYPTPYGSPTFASASPTIAMSAPRTLVPPPYTPTANASVNATPVSFAYNAQPANSGVAMPTNAPPTSIVVGNGVTYSSALVPVPSALVASNPMVNGPVVTGTPYPGTPLPMPGQVAPVTNAPMGVMPMAAAPNPYGNPYAGYPYGMPPQAPAPTSSAYSWMSSTGTLFPANLFQTRSAATAPVPNMAVSSNAPVYSSNAPNFWGRTAPTTMPPTWGTYPPSVTSASAGSYPYGYPTQPGVPPTVMR